MCATIVRKKGVDGNVPLMDCFLRRRFSNYYLYVIGVLVFYDICEIGRASCRERV